MRPEEVELIRRDYAANGGWETFLAYEDIQQVCDCTFPAVCQYFSSVSFVSVYVL